MRPDGRVANLRIPGQPDRPVALHRRDATELLSEELRRLDPDDVYARTLQALVERLSLPESEKRVPESIRKSEAVSAAKAAARTASKATGAKKTAALAASTEATSKKAATKKVTTAKKGGQ